MIMKYKYPYVITKHTLLIKKFNSYEKMKIIFDKLFAIKKEKNDNKKAYK